MSNEDKIFEIINKYKYSFSTNKISDDDALLLGIKEQNWKYELLLLFVQGISHNKNIGSISLSARNLLKEIGEDK